MDIVLSLWRDFADGIWSIVLWLSGWTPDAAWKSRLEFIAAIGGCIAAIVAVYQIYEIVWAKPRERRRNRARDAQAAAEQRHHAEQVQQRLVAQEHRLSEQSRQLAEITRLLTQGRDGAAAPAIAEAVADAGEKAARGNTRMARALALLSEGRAEDAVPLFRAEAEEKAAAQATAAREAAAAYRHLGAIAYSANPKDARVAFAKACELDPTDHESGRLLGELLVQTGDLAGAERAYGRVLAPSNTPPADRDRLWALFGMGDIAQQRGDLGAALARYGEARALADRLAKADPGNAGWQRDLSVSYNKVGDVLVAQGQLPDALKAFRDSLAIADRLAKADPANARWQRDLAISYGRLASVDARSGDRARAVGAYRQGRDIIAKLKAASPSNAELPKDLAWFDAQITALEGK